MSNSVGIFFVGEAIADQRPDPVDPRCMKVALGGSMYFGSIGCALAATEGVESFYVGPISEDYFGGLMMADFQKHNVGLDYIRRTPFISMIAVVSEDGKGGNKYAFYGRNQMNTTEHLQIEDLPTSFTQEHKLFCFGSVTTTLSPSGQTLKTFANAQKKNDSIVLYDPNTRPSVIPDKDIYRASLEEWVKTASVVKASEEDILFTYPDKSFDEVAEHWLSLGVIAVFITRGENGCSIYTPRGSEHLAGLADETITSTVGAGDNFNAGILVHLTQKQVYTNEGMHTLDLQNWVDIANGANQTAFNHLKRINQK